MEHIDDANPVAINASCLVFWGGGISGWPSMHGPRRQVQGGALAFQNI